MNNFFAEDQDEIIVLGGGCFWCTEAVFKLIKGVVSVVPGYAGGHREDPVYEEVVTGQTGHAEVVEIRFDPAVISLEKILEIFFSSHDPTEKDRQGSDIGTQYRSIILYTTQIQKQKIQDFINRLEMSGSFQKFILTEVHSLEIFYPAEISHKDYFKNHSDQPYCKAVISPKINNIKEKFSKEIK